ncbi:protein LAZ1 homolog 1 isoform X1 [Aristolochia californica]|uniref:protein LAZ1 homolog 1 isoform X1 n=1 Tax=Aristolochia californica TaxID=171875 RepID=UPI0035D9977A
MSYSAWGPVCYAYKRVCVMEWMGTLFYLFSLLTVVESSSRLGIMLFVKTGIELKMLHSWPILSAGIFVLIALVLSVFLIVEHLAFYNQPEEQKFLIGLILMVPVYALESFFSLVDSDAAFNCEIMRDCYEAFALYCFERYLIACLGGEETTVKLMECENQVTSSTPLLEAAYAGVVKHPFPLNCLVRQWYLGADFYQAVKIGIVQYMILKMICAFLAIILEYFGVYGDGQFEWTYGYPYLAVILNFSQTWALYCLIQFYSVTKEMLEPIKPLAKFLVFKSIVFLTWWQGVIIAFLFSMGVLRSSLAQQLTTRIQDYIICIEMGFAAVVHIFVFPARPYQLGERCVRNVAVMSDYASLGAPPDPEEVRESERSTRVCLAQPDEKNMQLSFPQNVRDVVLGSGEIIVDDVKFTVSHVVEPMERGIAKLHKAFLQISENMQQLEKRKRSSKDDSYLIPMRPWSEEFPQDSDYRQEGSISDSGLAGGKRPLSTPRHPHQL